MNKFNLQKYLDGCVFASMVKKIGNDEKMIEYIIRCFVTSFFIYKFFIVWRILSSATKCYIRANDNIGMKFIYEAEKRKEKFFDNI